MSFLFKVFIGCVFLYAVLLIWYFDKQLVTFGSVTSKLSSLNVIRMNEDHEDGLTVIYNRVPKTGSTSFVGVAYDLCAKNNFRVIHINITSNMHLLTLSNQLDLATNITNWMPSMPTLYHGHMAFYDFSKFGLKKPLFINIVRKPLDRFISYYYFLRYGDNYRPNLMRRKHGNKMTLDECIQKLHSDCDLNKMWLQIPFFCGHSSDCWEPGNEWALDEAKRNLINQYFLVGLTEELNDFIAILEISLPRIFKDSLQHFTSSNKSHLRQTNQKIKPLTQTIRKIMSNKVWQMENDFYEFAKEQFDFIKQRILTEKKQIYFFEKIRPK